VAPAPDGALQLRARTRVGAIELDVALEVPAGGCLALAGPSGAGKTSVLRIAAGLLRPEVGRVSCGGELWLDTERGVDVAPERRRCGYVFQEYALFPHLRVWQNVAYPLHELPRAERAERARELLDRFGIAGLADARPRTLSGGERQRVALARALVTKPRCVLADEPTGNLDRKTAGEVFDLMLELNSVVGTALVIVTHDPELAARADRTLHLVDGVLR
jgi:molybdate transport system ATP-binding protein